MTTNPFLKILGDKFRRDPEWGYYQVISHTENQNSKYFLWSKTIRWITKNWSSNFSGSLDKNSPLTIIPLDKNLSLATKESQFIFKNTLHKQIDETAMEFPFELSLATVFFTYLE